MSPWRDAVDCYRADDQIAAEANLEVKMPEGYAAGDTVIHIVNAREPAILNVEELETGSDDDGFSVVDSADASVAGISVRAVELRLGEQLPAAPTTLESAFAERLLDAIDAESASPTPWYMTDTAGCLAQVRTGTRPNDDYAGPQCACCGADFGRVAHWDLTRALEWHVADRADGLESMLSRVVRVCAACHVALHTPFGPSVEELMYARRPECPRCDAQRTLLLVWGMPPGPPPLGTEIMGCTLDPSGTPDYQCGECGYRWFSDPCDDERPVWHREDSVSIDWRGGKIITITDLMRVSLDEVRRVLVSTAMSGSTITYGELAAATGSRYSPQSMGRLLDVISVDCHERREPSLAPLAISASTGKSGSSFVGDPDLGRVACYSYPHWRLESY